MIHPKIKLNLSDGSTIFVRVRYQHLRRFRFNMYKAGVLKYLHYLEGLSQPVFDLKYLDDGTVYAMCPVDEETE